MQTVKSLAVSINVEKIKYFFITEKSRWSFKLMSHSWSAFMFQLCQTNDLYCLFVKPHTTGSCLFYIFNGNSDIRVKLDNYQPAITHKKSSHWFVSFPVCDTYMIVNWLFSTIIPHLSWFTKVTVLLVMLQWTPVSLASNIAHQCFCIFYLINNLYYLQYDMCNFECFHQEVCLLI